MYQSILLAADGSENSYRAAEELLHFVGSETQVTILNVVDAEDSKTDVLHGSHEKSLTEERKRKLRDVINLLDKHEVKYSIKMEHGIPNKTVVKVANTGDYQAVVLGTRGLNSLQEMVLGSVSHKVAKRADIPVIIVK